MKIAILILLYFIPGLLLAQDTIPIEHGESYNPADSEPFLQDIYNRNDQVISFRVRFTDKKDEKSDYFILARKAGRLSAYSYVNKTGKLEMRDLPSESKELAWTTFIQNDLFTMQDEKDIPNFCLGKYQIYNSYTYEFVLYSGGRVKKLSYYNPEYYDNACYGMAERAKIINSVSVINYLLNN